MCEFGGVERKKEGIGSWIEDRLGSGGFNADYYTLECNGRNIGQNLAIWDDRGDHPCPITITIHN